MTIRSSGRRALAGLGWSVPVARAYRVYCKREPLPGGSYEMGHSATAYILDRGGRFVGPIGYGKTPDTVRPLLRGLLKA